MLCVTAAAVQEGRAFPSVRLEPEAVVEGRHVLQPLKQKPESKATVCIDECQCSAGSFQIVAAYWMSEDTREPTTHMCEDRKGTGLMGRLGRG